MIVRAFLLGAGILAASSVVNAAPVPGSPALEPGPTLKNSFHIADEGNGWKGRRKRGRKWDGDQREYGTEPYEDYGEREDHKHSWKIRRLREEHHEQVEWLERKHRREMHQLRREHRKQLAHAYRKLSRYGGPPPWARAHGWRKKQEHRFRYRHHDQIRTVTVAETVRLPETGFGQCNREIVGGLLGAAAGGLLGSKIGSGSGKTASVIGGTILGTLVGGSIGRSMDQVDQNCVGQVLERAPNGQPVVWQDVDARKEYEVTPTRTYQHSDGRYCREYQTLIVIDGREQQAHGMACRREDGLWEKTS